MKRGRKGFAALLAALLLAAVPAGCGQTEPAEAVNINYGMSNAWDSLMPYYTVSGSNYSRIVYDKLYDRLAYVKDDGSCLPRAATSWESDKDGYAILFHLDEKAKFHDGAPVTAQHWVDTLALITDADSGILGRPTFAVLKGTDDLGAAVAGEELGATAVDDHTLLLEFKNPVIPEEFLVENNRELYVLPTHLLSDIPVDELTTASFWQQPVGSGPCKFVTELSGSSLVLEANKDYQLGAPGFDTLTITVMDKANLLTALIAGDLDYYAFGGNLSEENRPVAEEAGFTVSESQVPDSFYELMLNNESISDPAIRQAIDLALDKELLCQQSSGTLGFVTNSSILPDTPYSRGMMTGSYDPQGAVEKLAKSDYNGETYTLACTSARASLAALIQQNLEDAGIPVEIETVDSSTMFSGMYDGLYDMAVASHTPTNLPLWFTGSRFSEDNNLFRVADLSPYQTLISAIQKETEQRVRVDLVDELEQYLDEELPFIPLWFYRALHVESNTVSGIDYLSSAFCNENVWEWEYTANREG